MLVLLACFNCSISAFTFAFEISVSSILLKAKLTSCFSEILTVSVARTSIRRLADTVAPVF